MANKKISELTAVVTLPDAALITAVDLTRAAGDQNVKIAKSDLITGGGGAVDSVNTQIGVVVLDTDDIADTATNRYTNDTDVTRLANTSGTNTGNEEGDRATITNVIPITNIAGSNYNFNTANTETAYTVTRNSVINQWCQTFINTLTKPTLTLGGVTFTEVGGIGWTASTDLYLYLRDLGVDGIHYSFLPKAVGSGGGTAPTTNKFIPIGLGDLTTSITVGTTKGYFRMPYGATLVGATVSLLDAGTVTGIDIDILREGISILSTNLTTDATEDSSSTASIPMVISDATLNFDDAITFDFIGVPTAGKGVIVTLELTQNVVVGTENYEYIPIPLSDLTSDLTVGVDKGYFDMPYAGTLIDAVISLKDGGTVNGITVDINKNAVSVLSTKITTDTTETTSVTATTPLVISDAVLAVNDRLTFDFDIVPTSAKVAILTLTINPA